MPCDSVRTTTVELGKVNHDRLAEVLQKQGWIVNRYGETFHAYSAKLGGVTMQITAGSSDVVVRGSYLAPEKAGEIIAGVKREYAAATVAEAARRFGFKVAQKTTAGEKLTLHMRR